MISKYIQISFTSEVYHFIDHNFQQFEGKPFEELNLKEKFPNLKIINGGSWMEKKKMKPKVDPMTMLRQYMEQQGLRLGPEFYFQNFFVF